MSGTSPRHDGAPRGPVVAGRRPLAIAGWLLPGGGAVRPPVASDPFWRADGGRRHSLGEVIAGQADDVRVQLIDAHAAAIGEVVRAAAAAKSSGESAVALVAAASRLLHEMIGQA